MKVIKLHDTDQKSERLYEAIKDAVYSAGENMTIGAVIGILEVVKMDVLREQEWQM